ncbi:MAG: STAS domain-containing protein [Oscillatoria sp. SIO1A7]|nr:STAS domain-containing protein [Oscillatoria sp. SIO1A7]
MEKNIEIVSPNGILDRTASSQFERKVSQCLEAGADIVLIDFQDVSFIDSSGLNALGSAIKAVQSEGKEIFCCSPNDQVKIVFDVSGFDRILELFEDRDEFEKKVLSKE